MFSDALKYLASIFGRQMKLQIHSYQFKRRITIVVFVVAVEAGGSQVSFNKFCRHFFRRR